MKGMKDLTDAIEEFKEFIKANGVLEELRWLSYERNGGREFEGVEMFDVVVDAKDGRDVIICSDFSHIHLVTDIADDQNGYLQAFKVYKKVIEIPIDDVVAYAVRKVMRNYDHVRVSVMDSIDVTEEFMEFMRSRGEDTIVITVVEEESIRPEEFDDMCIPVFEKIKRRDKRC
jgi:hypothetical protein